MIADEKSETEEREKGGGGERDEEEVGAREKSDAVKHSAVRVIRLRKSAGSLSTLLHFTGLPFYQFRAISSCASMTENP